MRIKDFKQQQQQQHYWLWQWWRLSSIPTFALRCTCGHIALQALLRAAACAAGMHALLHLDDGVLGERLQERRVGRRLAEEEARLPQGTADLESGRRVVAIRLGLLDHGRLELFVLGFTPTFGRAAQVRLASCVNAKHTRLFGNRNRVAHKHLHVHGGSAQHLLQAGAHLLLRLFGWRVAKVRLVVRDEEKNGGDVRVLAAIGLAQPQQLLSSEISDVVKSKLNSTVSVARCSAISAILKALAGLAEALHVVNLVIGVVGQDPWRFRAAKSDERVAVWRLG